MLTPFTQHRIVKWVNRIDSQRGGVSSPDRQQRMAALIGLAFDERLSYNSSCRPTVCMPIILWRGLGIVCIVTHLFTGLSRVRLNAGRLCKVSFLLLYCL